MLISIGSETAGVLGAWVAGEDFIELGEESLPAERAACWLVTTKQLPLFFVHRIGNELRPAPLVARARTPNRQVVNIRDPS